MIKVRISVEAEYDYDTKLFIERTLPALPKIGDFISGFQSELTELAKKDIRHLKFHDHCFYGRSSSIHKTPEKINENTFNDIKHDFSFSDQTYVTMLFFYTDEDYVWIYVGDDWKAAKKLRSWQDQINSDQAVDNA